MTILETRLRKLEARLPKDRAIDLLMPLCKQDMDWLCEEIGRDRMENVMLMCAHEAGPNILELFRGKIEDSLIRSVYNRMRNYAYLGSLRTTVRQRAGVIDEHASHQAG